MATYSKSKNVVFYHIPKCCGLYIDSILNDNCDFVTYNFLEGSEIDFYYDQNKSLREEFYRHLHCFLISKDDMKNCFEFTFVRNPYKRFISGWFYCISRQFEKNNVVFGSHFLDDLQNCINNKHLITQSSYFHMFKTQYMNIQCNSTQKKLDFIGRCENLIPDLQFVFKRIGLDPNFSKDKINENPIKYGDYRQYYTEEILFFVNRWFDEDFEIFNYVKVDCVNKLSK